MISALNYLKSDESAAAVSAINQLDVLRDKYFEVLREHELFGYAGFSLSTYPETHGEDSVIATVRIHHKVFHVTYQHVWRAGSTRELNGQLIFWRLRSEQERKQEVAASEFTVSFNTSEQFYLSGGKGAGARANEGILREPDVARLLVWMIKEAQATLPTLPAIDPDAVNP